MRLKVRNFYESDDQDTKEFIDNVNIAISRVNNINAGLEADSKSLHKIGISASAYIEDVNKKKVNVKKVKDSDIDIIKGNCVLNLSYKGKTLFEEKIPLNSPYNQPFEREKLFYYPGLDLLKVTQHLLSFMSSANYEMKQAKSANGFVPDEYK